MSFDSLDHFVNTLKVLEDHIVHKCNGEPHESHMYFYIHMAENHDFNLGDSNATSELLHKLKTINCNL